jgi:hypothetical protein
VFRNSSNQQPVSSTGARTYQNSSTASPAALSFAASLGEASGGGSGVWDVSERFRPSIGLAPVGKDPLIGTPKPPPLVQTAAATSLQQQRVVVDFTASVGVDMRECPCQCGLCGRPSAGMVTTKEATTTLKNPSTITFNPPNSELETEVTA